MQPHVRPAPPLTNLGLVKQLLLVHHSRMGAICVRNKSSFHPSHQRISPASAAFQLRILLRRARAGFRSIRMSLVTRAIVPRSLSMIGGCVVPAVSGWHESSP